jgi:hypothetical protein
LHVAAEALEGFEHGGGGAGGGGLHGVSWGAGLRWALLGFASWWWLERCGGERGGGVGRVPGGFGIGIGSVSRTLNASLSIICEQPLNLSVSYREPALT